MDTTNLTKTDISSGVRKTAMGLSDEDEYAHVFICVIETGFFQSQFFQSLFQLQSHFLFSPLSVRQVGGWVFIFIEGIWSKDRATVGRLM